MFSLHGISDSPDVFETNELKPITDYSKNIKHFANLSFKIITDDNFVSIVSDQQLYMVLVKKYRV